MEVLHPYTTEDACALTTQTSLSLGFDNSLSPTRRLMTTPTSVQSQSQRQRRHYLQVPSLTPLWESDVSALPSVCARVYKGCFPKAIDEEVGAAVSSNFVSSDSPRTRDGRVSCLPISYDVFGCKCSIVA